MDPSSPATERDGSFDQRRSWAVVGLGVGLVAATFLIHALSAIVETGSVRRNPA